MFATRAPPVTRALGQRCASGIALKYSNAVYGAALAKSPSVLTKVHSELGSISSTISQNPDLNAAVTNPTLSLNDRKIALDALFKKAEPKGALSDITKNLFLVLAENGRLTEAPGVIEGFNELVAKYKGELTVVVTSASPLSREILSRLESSLKQSQAAQQAKVLKVTNKVNPSVLGGIVVDFGDKSIDLSVQSRVTKLNQALQQSV